MFHVLQQQLEVFASRLTILCFFLQATQSTGITEISTSSDQMSNAPTESFTSSIIRS